MTFELFSPFLRSLNDVHSPRVRLSYVFYQIKVVLPKAFRRKSGVGVDEEGADSRSRIANHVRRGCLQAPHGCKVPSSSSQSSLLSRLPDLGRCDSDTP